MDEKDRPEGEPEGGFTVKDRRRFDSEGRPREDAEAGTPATEAGGAAETPDLSGGVSAEQQAEAAARAARAGGERQLPEIDFSTFVLSLYSSAMVQLGEAPHPDGSVEKDLDLARQTIDILGMLRDKTRGNLTDEESKLIEDLLYTVRLRYVAAAG